VGLREGGQEERDELSRLLLQQPRARRGRVAARRSTFPKRRRDVQRVHARPEPRARAAGARHAAPQAGEERLHAAARVRPEQALELRAERARGRGRAREREEDAAHDRVMRGRRGRRGLAEQPEVAARRGAARGGRCEVVHEERRRCREQAPPRAARLGRAGLVERGEALGERARGRERAVEGQRLLAGGRLLCVCVCVCECACVCVCVCMCVCVCV
jgi:hypothetical protein